MLLVEAKVVDSTHLELSKPIAARLTANQSPITSPLWFESVTRITAHERIRHCSDATSAG